MTCRRAARRSSSSPRSRTMPSSRRPSPCSGCGRRTDSKRRTSASSVASRNSTRCPTPPLVEVRQRVAQGGEERPAADVDERRRAAAPRGRPSCASSSRRLDELRRQVVDDVPAEVLEDLRRRRPAGPGHAGDDQQLGAGMAGCTPSWIGPAVGVAGPSPSRCVASRSRSPRPGRRSPASLDDLTCRHVDGGFRRLARRARRRRPRPCAGPMPCTAAISSALAARSRFTEPKARSSAFCRAGPRPGHLVQHARRHRLAAAAGGGG